jgi:hypothetical protein
MAKKCPIRSPWSQARLTSASVGTFSEPVQYAFAVETVRSYKFSRVAKMKLLGDLEHSIELKNGVNIPILGLGNFQ